MSNLSTRLNALITENSLNPFALSKKLGVSSSVVRKWLRPYCDVTLANLVRLADFFDCSIEYLTGRSDDLSACGFKPIPDFAPQLRKVIDQSGRSIYDICKHTTLAWGCFYDWFHGQNPRLSSLSQLADYFGITIDELVGRERDLT